MSDNIDLWTKCYQGDFAGSVDLDPESGMRAIQVFGTDEPEACQALTAQMTSKLGEIPADGEPPFAISVAEGQLSYKGVSATRYEWKFDLEKLAPGDDPNLQFLEKIFGDGLTIYMGLKNGWMLSTTGPDAEQAFKDLVKRSSSRKRMDGISESTFAPLTMGPGIFAEYHRSRLLAVLPEEEFEDAEGKIAREIFKEVRVALGTRFESGALLSQIAVPLKMFERIGEVTAEADASRGP
jgi:hypothetical protein